MENSIYNISDITNKILNGDSLEELKKFPDECIDMCVTSPPYFGLRDYGTGTWEGGDINCDHLSHSKFSDKTGLRSYENKELLEKDNKGYGTPYKNICKKCGAIRIDKQIGLEETPEEYIEKLILLFKEVKRVLKPEGTLWVNIGDSYSGSGKGQTRQGCTDPKRSKIEGMKLKNSSKGFEGMKPKDLIGIPWSLAFALRADGWYLRQDIIWNKPNAMPESVTDRCTKSHEYIFLLGKSQHYYFDNIAIQEEATGYDGRKDIIMKGSQKYKNGGYLQQGNANSLSVNSRERWKRKYEDNDMYGTNSKMIGHSGYNHLDNPYVRNKRSVWTVPTKPFKEAHFATFPEDLIFHCILAGCPKNGIVLDVFSGAGTTALVAVKNNRNYVGIELNSDYIKIANNRIRDFKRGQFRTFF